ncbi:hypothetical protein Bbelb_082360 [Branchiostoma belcheri]|nr:hypothetical protein Bbelb_082360 [Branchiostoma belcheri]
MCSAVVLPPWRVTRSESTIYTRRKPDTIVGSNAVYARPPLMFLEGPSYRSESFELRKILRAVRRGQFSAPAKFIPAPPTPSQERRYTNARVTAKPTLATAEPTLNQRRLQRYTAKPTSGF